MKKTPRELAEAAVERLCNDPQVWKTHGLPSDDKLKIIIDEIAWTIRYALNQATDE